MALVRRSLVLYALLLLVMAGIPPLAFASTVRMRMYADGKSAQAAAMYTSSLIRP
jgi:hypothetical protein